MRKRFALFSVCMIFFILLFAYGLFTLDGSNLNKPLDPKIYFDLLSKLKAQGYNFILSRDYNQSTRLWLSYSIVTKTALIFHDCDFNFNGLKTLINIEQSLDIRSTVFVRPNTEYFEGAVPYLLNIQSQGWEIAYHYDTLSKTNDTALALKEFEAQSIFLRTFFNIEATRPHGDIYNLEIYNGNLYNATLWKQLGLKDMTLMVAQEPSVQYATDTDKVLTIPQTFDANLVILSFHSDWWP